MKDGWIEPIPWDPEWDRIRKKDPNPLLYIIPIAFLLLTAATVFNDPNVKQKRGRMAISLIWFGLMAMGFIIPANNLDTSNSLQFTLEWLKIGNVFMEMALYLVLPYLFVFAFFHEGLLTFLIRLKYMFSNISVEEALMERAKRQEYEKKKREYETKESEIDRKEQQVRTQLSRVRDSIPEVADVIPSDIVEYQGLFREVEKRFIERQILKTTKVARERLEEVRKLCEEGAKLQRARADLEVAKFELETVGQDIGFKKKERTLKDKQLDRDILQTDQEIAFLKKASRKKKREDFEL
jgi:hypothetical protein